jgi:hypothetical protein
VFHREAGSQHVMVALNFSDAPRRIEIPRTSILLSSANSRGDSLPSGSFELLGYEAIVFDIK